MTSVDEVEILWSMFGKLAVLIGTIVAIVQGIKYLMSLMPTSKLEKRIAECESHNKSDFEHLKSIEIRVSSLENELKETNIEIDTVNEGIQRIGRSQITLLRHLVTGNGQKDMEKEADDLTEYFINRK